MDQPTCGDASGSLNSEPRCLKLVDILRSAFGIRVVDEDVDPVSPDYHRAILRRRHPRLWIPRLDEITRVVDQIVLDRVEVRQDGWEGGIFFPQFVDQVSYGKFCDFLLELPESSP